MHTYVYPSVHKPTNTADVRSFTFHATAREMKGPRAGPISMTPYAVKRPALPRRKARSYIGLFKVCCGVISGLG